MRTNKKMYVYVDFQKSKQPKKMNATQIVFTSLCFNLKQSQQHQQRKNFQLNFILFQ